MRSAVVAEAAPTAWPRRSRYCPAIISPRMARHTAVIRRRREGGRHVSATVSSAHTRARSPARTAAEGPNAPPGPEPAGRPRRSARAMWTAGLPRRVGDRSITSSWMRAQVWISSRATPSRNAAAVSAAPQARMAHQSRRGLIRLPPRSVKSATRCATSSAKTGSCSAASATRSARTASAIRWRPPGTSWSTARASSAEGPGSADAVRSTSGCTDAANAWSAGSERPI